MLRNALSKAAIRMSMKGPRLSSILPLLQDVPMLTLAVDGEAAAISHSSQSHACLRCWAGVRWRWCPGRDAREAELAELAEVESEAFASGVSGQGTHCHYPIKFQTRSRYECSLVVASTSITNSSKSTSQESRSCAYMLRPAMTAYGLAT